jgi:hypothetical protein
VVRENAELTRPSGGIVTNRRTSIDATRPLRDLLRSGISVALALAAVAMPADGQQTKAGGRAKAERASVPKADSVWLRYAARLERTADSAFIAGNSISDSLVIDLVKHSMLEKEISKPLVPFDSAARLTAANEITSFTNDFDVVAPPAELERGHGQLMEALQRLAAGHDSVQKYAIRCNSRSGNLGYCSTPFVKAVGEMLGGQNDYLAARRRVASILATRGVALAKEPATITGRRADSGRRDTIR